MDAGACCVAGITAKSSSSNSSFVRHQSRSLTGQWPPASRGVGFTNNVEALAIHRSPADWLTGQLTVRDVLGGVIAHAD